MVSFISIDPAINRHLPRPEFTNLFPELVAWIQSESVVYLLTSSVSVFEIDSNSRG